ncbi:MAG TPA: hypothetical protein VLF94_00525 [Chlamydiales bacterium]|nr:hypothetical protein [Chlamydiales bacterium]
MSPRQALASALHLFVVFAFFVAGLFFVCLPYLPETRIQIIDFFSHDFERCTLIGLAFFLTSVLFLLGFYALDRGRYLVIRMGLSADINIVRQTLEECFQHQFSKRIHLNEVEIGRRYRLNITVSLAPLSEEAREDLFIEAEKQLTLLLRERFGYSKPFYLIVKV